MQDAPVRRSIRKRKEVDIAVRNLENDDLGAGRRKRTQPANTGANIVELQHSSEASDGSGAEEANEADEEWQLGDGAAGGGRASAAAGAAAAADAGGEFADGRWGVL